MQIGRRSASVMLAAVLVAPVGGAAPAAAAEEGPHYGQRCSVEQADRTIVTADDGRRYWCARFGFDGGDDFAYQDVPEDPAAADPRGPVAFAVCDEPRADGTILVSTRGGRVWCARVEADRFRYRDYPTPPGGRAQQADPRGPVFNMACSEQQADGVVRFSPTAQRLWCERLEQGFRFGFAPDAVHRADPRGPVYLSDCSAQEAEGTQTRLTPNAHAVRCLPGGDGQLRWRDYRYERRLPELLVVRWLSYPANCVGTLRPLIRKRNAGWKSHEVEGAARGTCEGLKYSANKTSPPARLQGPEFTRFLDKKEYRQIIKLPAVRVRCNGYDEYQGASLESQGYDSAGWTPYPKPQRDRTVTRAYAGAERIGSRYAMTVNGAARQPFASRFVRSDLPDGTGVSLSMRTAARLENPSRTANWRVVGYDTPYIWTALHRIATCTGGGDQELLAGSFFPNVALYVDGVKTQTVPQATDFTAMVTSGGRSLHRTGEGLLVPHTRIWRSAGLRNPVKATPGLLVHGVLR